MARDMAAKNPAPAYSAEGLAHLVQEIDALLHHLARAEPGVLEACFVDSRGAGVAASKVLPPRAMDAAPETLRNFIERVAAITAAFSARAAGKPAAAAELMPATEYAYLLEVRSFLAQLVLPASVDTILVTQGYHDGLACLARLPGWSAGVGALLGRVIPPLRQDRRGGPALAPPPLPAPLPALVPPPLPEPEAVRLHPATESGWRFARLARHLRRSAVVMVCVTLAFALYVFAGKTLQEEAQRLQSALAGIQQQIDSDFDRNAPRPNVTPERAVAASERLVQLREAGFVFDATLSYCDQPFLDDTGVIRYARPSQELNCNRLWGVNRAVNQNNRQMQAWIAPAILPPFSWLFGLFDVVDTIPAQPALDRARVGNAGELQMRAANRVGLLRVFPENARSISQAEAEALAVRRACETSERTKGEAQVAGGGGTLPEAEQRAGTREAGQDASVGAVPTRISGQAPPPPPQAARAVLCGLGIRPVLFEEVQSERTRIVNGAVSQFVTLRLALPINSQTTEQANPIRVRVVIEGLTLYVLPVLFSVLGAYVSVLREIRRRADAALLALTEQSRMLTTLVLGASFGAVVSLLAEILRGGGAASPTTAAITLGLWPLAFLAGYAVSHVFRMLDAAVDRIFGLRHPSDRGSPARGA